MVVEKRRIVTLMLVTVLTAIGLSFALSLYVPTPSSACASSNPPPDLKLPTMPPSLSNGEVAPDFTATDIEGNPIHLADLRGKIVILNFMGTWCQSCIWEASRLVEVYNKYKDQGVMMVSISIEPDRSLDNLLEFKSEYCADWTFILDDGGLMKLYSIVNIPTTYVIDTAGNVAYGHVGLIEVEEISSTIDKLLV